MEAQRAATQALPDRGERPVTLDPAGVRRPAAEPHPAQLILGSVLSPRDGSSHKHWAKLPRILHSVATDPHCLSPEPLRLPPAPGPGQARAARPAAHPRPSPGT